MKSLNQSLNATPAFWKVDGPKGILYILGSLHLLPENCHWLSPVISQPLVKSDFFIGEIRDLSENEILYSKEVKPGGRCLSNSSLKEILDGETFENISDLMDRFGFIKGSWENYKPWYINNVLISNLSQESGYSPNFGIEAVIFPQLKEIDKPSFGLENPEIQFLVFNNLTLETQLERLHLTLKAQTQFGQIFQTLFKSWATGNIDALNELMIKPLMVSPEFYNALLPNRHPSWIRQIKRFLEIPGNYFLAAGVNHFIGPDSILTSLEKEGYSVTRIQ